MHGFQTTSFDSGIECTSSSQIAPRHTLKSSSARHETYKAFLTECFGMDTYVKNLLIPYITTCSRTDDIQSIDGKPTEYTLPKPHKLT